MVLGADASTSRDDTALTGVYQHDGLTDVIFSQVWKPGFSLFRTKPTVDLSETIGAEILRLHKAGLVIACYYDPYQLHSIALDLARQGVNMRELPQTGARVEADTSLYDAIVGHTLRHYNDPTLNEHIANAVAVETVRGIRLAKERTTRKIDAAVALSMAHYGAVESAFVGGVVAVPNIFYDYDLEEFAAVNGRFIYAPGYHEHHSRGAHSWHDCKYLAAGCKQCMQELDQEGYYDLQDREREELENQVPMSEEDAYRSLRAATGQDYRQQLEDRDGKFLQKFRKNVRNRLEKRTGIN
jgi:hypothetical protein